MLDPERAIEQVQARLEQREGFDPPPPDIAALEQQLFWLARRQQALEEQQGRFGRELAVRRSGLAGRIESLVKRVLRRLLREQTRPQREFNAEVARCLTISLECMQALAAELRRVRAGQAGAAATAPAGQTDHAPFLAQAAPLGGEALRPFLADLSDAAPVAVLGCGDGVLLALLRDRSIEAHGAETSPTWIATCRAQGLAVHARTAGEHLAATPPGALGGIFFARLECHEPPEVQELLALAAARLALGGVLVAFSPNPLHDETARTFHRDPARRRPLDPELLRHLASSAGLVFQHFRLVDPGDRLLESVLGAAEARQHRHYGAVLRKLDCG